MTPAQHFPGLAERVQSQRELQALLVGYFGASTGAAAALIAAGERPEIARAVVSRGGRPDLADREASEAAIIQKYLPEPVDPARLDEMIDAAIAETGAAGPADMGKVMGRLMPQVKGRVDGADLSRRVRERLA